MKKYLLSLFLCIIFLGTKSQNIDLYSVEGKLFSDTASFIKIRYYVNYPGFKDSLGVKVFSSNDSNLSESDVLIKNINVKFKGWGYNYLLINIDDPSVLNQKHAIVVINDDQSIFEKKYDDNISSSYTSIKEHKMDWSFYNISSSQVTNLPFGSDLKFSFRILNGGDLPAAYDGILAISQDSIFDASDSIYTIFSAPEQEDNSIGNGFFKTITASGEGLSGVVYAIIKIDPNNKFVETNEENNTVVFKYVFQNENYDPGLHNHSIYPLAPFVSAGADMKFYISNKNYGNTPPASGTLKSFSTKTYISSNAQYNASEDSLVLISSNSSSNDFNAKESSLRTAKIPATFKNYPIVYLISFIDQPQAENNTLSNDTIITEIELVPAKPNIIYENYSFQLTTYVTGGDSVLKGNNSYYNNGTANCDQLIVNYYLSDNLVLEASDILLLKDSLGLIQNNNYAYSRPDINLKKLNVEYGSYYVFKVIDPDQLCDEIEEFGDTSFIALYYDTIAPKQDLFYEFTEISKNELEIGKSFSARGYVINTLFGLSSTNVNVYVSEDATFDLDDELLHTFGEIFSPDFNGEIIFNSQIAKQDQYILIVVNPDSLIDETFFFNNVAAYKVKVKNPIVVETTTLEENPCFIYPTLVEDQVTVDFNNPYSVKVFDTNGHVVFSDTDTSTQNFKLDIISGVYIVEIKHDQGIIRQRLIKR